MLGLWQVSGPPRALGADPSVAVTTQPPPPNPSSPPSLAWADTGFTAPRCTQRRGVSGIPALPTSTALLPTVAATVPNRHPSRPELSQGPRAGGVPARAFPLSPLRDSGPGRGCRGLRAGLGRPRGLQMSSAQLLFQEALGTPCRAAPSPSSPSPSTHSPAFGSHCHPCLLSGLRSWAPGLRAGRLGMNRAPGRPCWAGLN